MSEEMKAINRLVQEKVFEKCAHREVFRYSPAHERCVKCGFVAAHSMVQTCVPEYSNLPGGGFEVIVRMNEKGFYLSGLNQGEANGGHPETWEAEFIRDEPREYFQAQAISPAMAICRAALSALGVEV